jgi:aflatoxin B1 aldehyde reductase
LTDDAQVDVFYIHMPDRSTDLADTLAGIQALYEAGSFKRFGLSNYLAKEVEEVYNLCKEKGYVLPTVYQGNYNPVARTQETALFPTLRKLGISFYAYSPLAGGFLTKTRADIEAGKGRFDTSDLIGKMYAGLYGKPELLESLAQWEETAKDEGCSRADLAYRWVRYNSPLKPEFGDAMIVGASNLKQLKQTIEGSNAGPLSAKAVKRIDAIWELVKSVAPLDNINSGPIGEQMLKGTNAATFLPPKENA